MHVAVGLNKSSHLINFEEFNAHQFVKNLRLGQGTLSC